ncbi:hypothetical protein D7X25_35330 [bacterium 1XD42-8]|nr:hypothetical protein D7X25_35330 [bacterium 1XD42-8]
MKKESIEFLHQGGTKLMELIFCGKRDVRAVLILYKYCPYFRDFVGICFNLICMWNGVYFYRIDPVGVGTQVFPRIKIERPFAELIKFPYFLLRW